MIYKVKNLYVVFSDDCGHDYLIPKNEYLSFKTQLDKFEKEYSDYRKNTPQEERDEDLEIEYEERINSLFDDYNRLEGDSYYVVLLEDFINE